MTYWELYQTVPGVVAENMGPIRSALDYVGKILVAAEDDEHREEARKLIDRIQQQEEQLHRIARNLQKSIYQMAMMAKCMDGFPPVEEMHSDGV